MKTSSRRGMTNLRGFWLKRLLYSLLPLLMLLPGGRAFAQDYPGTYSMTVEVSTKLRLHYTLTLSPPQKEGANTGDAEMRVARRGLIATTGNIKDDYGSMLYIYLRDSERTYHVGNWTRSGNQVIIRLSDIEGRRDKADFTGALEGKRIVLTCSNPGMYGHQVQYRMKRDLEESDGTIRGQYRLVREEKIEGQTVRLEYTLFLRSNAEAEMRIVCEKSPGKSDKVGSVFGSIATVYLQEERLRVYHRGTWKQSGGSITISLTDIIGRRDKAEFFGSITPNKLELACNNRGMYGVTKLTLQRDDVNAVGPGRTLD